MPEGNRASAPGLVAVYFDGRPPPNVAELQARMALLTAFVGGILFEVDIEGRYLSIFTGNAGLLARPIESFAYGVTLCDVLGPELGATFTSMVARVIATDVPETYDYTLEVEAGRRNFRCEVRATLAGASDPIIPSATLLVRDVTEETELKARLVEAERLAAMGLVAASVAHEIRQPLAFATTSLEILSRELDRSDEDRRPPGGRAREALAHVRDAVRRLAGIASSVGVVAVPDHPRDTSTDVRRPIEAAIGLCASELQGRARVTVAVPDLPRVRGNEGELCQVFANLLLNAAHAVDGRGGDSGAGHRIHVAASLTGSSGDVRVSVSDDGCGIDPANVARVFDPFFTTKEPGRGTGLGLFVARRIVEEAGGLLAIESRVDAGTTVHVTLPVAIGEAPARSAPPPAPSAQRLTILVVDDEPAFLRSLELVLEDSHEVVVCHRASDALELVRAKPARFDAVLCDLSMPDVDGAAFYRQMEALGIADRFILMTAGAFTAAGEELLRDARCRRINKPFTFERLIDVLAAATMH
jgi:signal transduction histidine kinase